MTTNSDLSKLIADFDFESEKAKAAAWIKEQNLSFDELIELYAAEVADHNHTLELNKALNKAADIDRQLLIDNAYKSLAIAKRSRDDFVKLREDVQPMLAKAIKAGMKEGKSLIPRMGANKTNERYVKIKQKAFVWLDQNRDRFPSMNNTAENMCKKFPISFRTAYKYVREWKELRSASAV